MRNILLLISMLILSACSSSSGMIGYYPAPYSGSDGYSDIQIDKNMFRVSYHGSADVMADEAEELTLLRSAELTLKNGFTHFAIVDGVSRSDGTQSTGAGVGNAIRGTSMGISVGSSHSTSKPSTTNTIICFNGKPSDFNGIVYDAKFLFDTFSKKFVVVDEKVRRKPSAFIIVSP
jgi:hypothetical protein